MEITNIAETLKQVAKDKGEETGLIEAKSGGFVSFSELDSRSDAYATYLNKKGLSAGQTVVLIVKPSAEFICLTFALFKIGTPIVLIDPGMGYKNLLRCIERVSPKVLIGIPKALLFKKLFPNPFKSIKRTFCCGNSLGLLGTDITRCKSNSAGPYPTFKPTKDDLAAIIFTTGSTGPPKGVRYEHSIFSAQLRLIRDYYKIGSSDIDQPAFPLFALFSTALGACAVIPDMDTTKPAKVDPAKFISSIIKHKVTYSFGSPAIWNVVRRYCIEKNIILENVSKVLMAGAPVPYELLKRVASILPADATISTPYGATESLPIVSITGKEVLEETWEKSKEGRGTCVGKVLPGIGIKIIGISDHPLPTFFKDMELGTGQIGEIIVRGDVVTKAYENNQEETMLAKIADGQTFWHRMGDVGYIDDKKRLWFCGRRAHRVETVDKTHFTICSEAIVNEHPEVYRSALVGISAGNDGDKKVAVMIIEPHNFKNLDRNKILQEVEEMAGANALTKDIKYFLIHKSFPVDIRHNAKIFREKLAVWAQKKLFRQL